MEKYNSRNASKKDSELLKVYNYPSYLRDSKICSDKGFVNFDTDSMGGSHWTCFIVKNNKSFHLHSFGGQLDEFLPNQLPKPILYHKYEIQDKNSHLGGSYCL